LLWGRVKMYALLITIPLALISGVAGAEGKPKTSFSETQKKVLTFSYYFGSQVGLGYELAAIAWNESSAGLLLKNKQAPSFGIYQIYLPTAYKLAKQKGYKISKKKLRQLLLSDHELNASFALSILTYFLKHHNGSLEEALASYYAGFNTDKGKGYARSVLSKMEYLKHHREQWLVNTTIASR